jgi:hypothetical protein
VLKTKSGQRISLFKNIPLLIYRVWLWWLLGLLAGGDLTVDYPNGKGKTLKYKLEETGSHPAVTVGCRMSQLSGPQMPHLQSGNLIQGDFTRSLG